MKAFHSLHHLRRLPKSPSNNSEKEIPTGVLWLVLNCIAPVYIHTYTYEDIYIYIYILIYMYIYHERLPPPPPLAQVSQVAL